MPFSRVCGQAVAKTLLAGIVRSGRVAHAYLFCGPDGTGKSIAATEFVMAVNCADGPRLGEACGTCSTCRRIESGNHPDAMVIEPEGQSVRIDQARSVLKHVSFKPMEARVKSVVIKRAELMTPEAANCLLKGLEEPPGVALFVLTTPSTTSMLPTVVSRCEVVPFSACSVEEVQSYLARRHPGGDARLRAAALWSAGIPGRGDIFFDETFTRVRGMAHSAISGLRDLDVVGLSGEIGKEEAPLFLDCLESVLRDIAVAGSGSPAARLLNPDYAAELSSIARDWTPQTALAACERVGRARAAMAANSAPRLVIEVLMMSLQAGACGGYN